MQKRTIKMKSSDIKRLETLQASFYMRLIGVPMGTSNIAISQELGILPVEHKIHNKKLPS